MFFCVLFTLNSNTTLGKNAIFCWFLFPQVVQKLTVSEVGNYETIWLQVVSGIPLPKIIKIR